MGEMRVNLRQLLAGLSTQIGPDRVVVVVVWLEFEFKFELEIEIGKGC